MKKTLVALALATLPALVLGGCNGSSGSGAGVAPLPNAAPALKHGRMRRNDNGPQDLHAGGADVPAVAYNRLNQPVGYYNQAQSPPAAGSLFYAAPTTGTIYYCINSSTDGRKAFYGSGDTGFPPTGPCAPLGSTATGFGGRQDPLDFAASAVALTSAEYTTYKSVREAGSVQWGEPFEFPNIGGPIVFDFRPKDFKGNVTKIHLSTWTYCAISNGTVADWNDGAITADNGKSVTGGVSQPITFFFRADSAGTTSNFTNHLNTACNVTFGAPYNGPPYGGGSRSAAWSFGVSSTWPGPGSAGDPNARFIGETGDAGILAGVQTTAYSTGYNQGGYVALSNPKVGQAWLQNGSRPTNKGQKPIWVNPVDHATLNAAFAKVTAANILYGGGSDGNPLATSAPWCILYVDPSNYVSPPAKSYPIVDVSYLLFYGQNNGVHVSDKQKLITFLESSAANKITNKLEYAALSSSVENAVTSALNGNGGSQPACLQ